MDTTEPTTGIFDNLTAFLSNNWYWLLLALLVIGGITAMVASALAERDAQGRLPDPHRVVGGWLKSLWQGNTEGVNVGGVVIWLFCVFVEVVAVLGLLTLNMQSISEFMTGASQADVEAVMVFTGLSWMTVAPVVGVVAYAFTVVEMAFPAIMAHMHEQEKEGHTDGYISTVIRVCKGAIVALVCMELVVSVWRGLLEGGIISSSNGGGITATGIVSGMATPVIAVLALIAGMVCSYLIKRLLHQGVFILKTIVKSILSVGVFCPGILMGVVMRPLLVTSNPNTKNPVVITQRETKEKK